MELIERSDLGPRFLELELTETMACELDASLLERLQVIRSHGIRVAIDDFGTGYSSLGYLHRLPSDTLKIDKSFIDQIREDQSSATLTKAVVGLAQQFHLDVVGEGIENAGQAEYLRSENVLYGQGYYFGRPVPAADFEKFSKGVSSGTS